MSNSITEQTLHTALRRDAAATPQGILQRIFTIWFDAFVYNQIWEDPAVDLQALRLERDSRILTISSGGCNALNYLLENPASVTAVDLNQNHIFLLNLKKAAVEYLPSHAEFFEFFGSGPGAGTVRNYERFIAGNLDAETRDFWGSNSLAGKLICRRRLDFFRKGGLYEHSRNGYFLRVFHRLAKISGCDPEAVLAARSAGEQIRLYEKNIEPFFDSLLMRFLAKMPVTLFGLGIPPQQFAELKKDLEGKRGIIDIYRERAKKLAVGFPIGDNYFAWQAFGRKYDTANRRAIPEYLKEPNFGILKENISKLRTAVRSVTDEIEAGGYGRYNRFVFLDAQDWMDSSGLSALWTLISERAESGSRIIFRTAASTSPLEKALPGKILERFEYLRDESQKLFEKDRASIYGGFHLYVVR